LITPRIRGTDGQREVTIITELRSYPGFPGKIGRTREGSQPHWELPVRPPPGAPNIVIVLMDDMGWADVGCYGSEIATPNIDALAGRGIRFTHYTTHPIWPPARAALLTGRNAHSVATGWLAQNNPGFPGYFGDIPLDAPTIAETLRAAGYATIAVGKWHNSTDGVSPNPTWPTYRGFGRFYGFLEGETGYFFPARIVYNNIVAPIDEYPPGYYATDDWMDKAIRFVTEIRNRSYPAILPLCRQQCRARASAAGTWFAPRALRAPGGGMGGLTRGAAIGCRIMAERAVHQRRF